MKNIFAKQRWIAALFFSFLFVLLTVVWRSPTASPLSVSIAHLGYTNGVGPGPYALFAITNCSDSAVTLDSMCMVKYSPARGADLRRVSSFEPSTLRVTQLRPGEGFVQDVFVFPASQGEWQFECHAAYSSRWLEVRRFAENRVRKLFPRLRPARRSKAWHKFDTAWLDYPTGKDFP